MPSSGDWTWWSTVALVATLAGTLLLLEVLRRLLFG